MAPFSPTRGLVAPDIPKRSSLEIENKQQRAEEAEDNKGSFVIPIITAGLGRRRGVPSLTSLYKATDCHHELTRTQLFEKSALDCYNNWVRGEQDGIRQAFDFIREQCSYANLPKDIWQGLFAEQYQRFVRDKHLQNDGLPLFTEEFLVTYINSLEAAVQALETEGAIAMFAEDEPVLEELLTLKLYLPFTDSMDQQNLIDKEVQLEIDLQYMFHWFRFYKSLSTPVVRRLLDFKYKLDLYGYRKVTLSQCFSDPFYSAEIFRRTLDQTNAWFYAGKDPRRVDWSPEGDLEEKQHRSDWLFYEKHALLRSLQKKDPKEERDFILRTKEKILDDLSDFFWIFWELQERERRLSIVTVVEAWVKQQQR